MGTLYSIYFDKQSDITYPKKQILMTRNAKIHTTSTQKKYAEKFTRSYGRTRLSCDTCESRGYTNC